jgi:hypothetical protein
VGKELPSFEYVPVLQDWHAALELAPSADEDLPASQRMHVEMAVAAAASEYEPAAQRVHAAAPAVE